MCAKNSEAQVIYYDVDPDIMVEVGSDFPDFVTHPLDINFDGTNDFMAAVRSTGFCSACINMSSAYIQGLGANEVGARSILYDMTCSTYTTFILSETIKIAENIGSGHTIPGSLDYNPDPAFMFKQDGGYGYCYFNNVGEEDRESTFMPIKFYLDGQIHFGWIRYKSEQVVEDSQLFTRIYIEEYAYNLTADSSVVTAQIPVGLPSNTAYNIEPVIQTERNQLTIIPPAFASSQCAVQVFNLSGELVFGGQNESQYQIPLNGGMYIIRLLWKDIVWSGKTVIAF